MLLFAAARIRPIVRVVPRQRHITHPQPIELAQRRQGIFDRVSTFDSHQAGNLVLCFRAPNVGRGGREHQVVRMPFNRAIDRIDHVERAPRRAAMRDVPGLDVEREKLSAEAALLHAFDTRAIRRRRRPAKIVIVIGHGRGHVVVRVDYDRAPLNRERSLPQRFIPWRAARRLSLRRLSSPLRADRNCRGDECENEKGRQHRKQQSWWFHGVEIYHKRYRTASGTGPCQLRSQRERKAGRILHPTRAARAGTPARSRFCNARWYSRPAVHRLRIDQTTCDALTTRAEGTQIHLSSLQSTGSGELKKTSRPSGETSIGRQGKK